MHALNDEMCKALESIETRGNETVAVRVDALTKSKLDAERRIARLNDYSATVYSIRNDFDELTERERQVERSLKEAEVDSNGKTLVDRLDALGAFAAQTRNRLNILQDLLATLNGFKGELTRYQGDLGPLTAPASGIDALMTEANSLRDRLASTLAAP